MSRSDSVAHYVVRQVLVGGAATPVEEVRGALDGRHESLACVYVVDGERLLGRVPLQDVLAAPAGTALSALQRPAHAVRPTDPPVRAAEQAMRDGIPEVPVVTEAGQFLGVVPAGPLLRTLRREHVEDLHRLAGIAREDPHLREAVEEAPARRARHRLPWLLVGLAGSVLSAALMGRFESTLSANVAVAYFVPGIVYLADAIGTQTETIAVRALSLTQVPLGRMLLGELWTGVLIGGVLGAVLGPVVWLGWGDGRLALAVSGAVLVAGAAATTIGLLLPWAIQRSGRDPAFGSGPLATILQDVLSLLVYFAAVRALLG